MTALLIGAKCVQCFCNAFYRARGRVVIEYPLLLPAPFQDDVPRAGWKYVPILKTTSDNGILATMLFLVYKEKVIIIQERIKPL